MIASAWPDVRDTTRRNQWEPLLSRSIWVLPFTVWRGCASAPRSPTGVPVGVGVLDRRIAGRTGPRPPAGPKAPCATPATPQRYADEAPARTAVTSGDWSHHQGPERSADATAPDFQRCTPARSAGARTSSTNGAVAIAAPSPDAPPRR